MKKLLVTLLLLCASVSVHASELSEDYTDIAAQYCIEGNYREALNYVNKIIYAEPENADAKRLKAALVTYSRPSNSSPLQASDTGINSLQTALNQYNAGDYAGAVTILNTYIKTSSNSDFAYALRAKANTGLAQYENAQSDINAALALNNDLTYRFIAAKIDYQRGNFRIARQKFQNLTGDIQTSEIYKYIGLCDYAMKNYTDALLNLDKAIILSDEDKGVEAKYNEVRKIISE
jgi:tetratricopeptide (TPR) repeat protein